MLNVECSMFDVQRSMLGFGLWAFGCSPISAFQLFSVSAFLAGPVPNRPIQS
jgi:hypothetical protein